MTKTEATEIHRRIEYLIDRYCPECLNTDPNTFRPCAIELRLIEPKRKCIRDLFRKEEK